VKVLAPIDARGLSWLAFSRRCCGLRRPPSEWDAATFAAAAQLLTSHAPFAVPFSRLKVQVHMLPSAAMVLWGAVNSPGKACMCESFVGTP